MILIIVGWASVGQDNTVSINSMTKWEPLMDSHGRPHTYLRISLTDRCNFRCTYCMPEEKVAWKPREELLDFDEIERLVRVFAKLGIDKVRLTGGEPTVRRNYLEIVERIAQVPGIRSLSMTTNGSSLASDAPRLREAGLQSINVSLDTLRHDRFLQITQRDEFNRVMAGVEAAYASGLETKINVVLLPGINDDEILDFVQLARDRALVVRFIEFMPFLDNGWAPSRVIASSEIRAIISQRYELQPLPALASDVAREYTIPDFLGRIGLVSSVTESFCEGCNRIRLTADGQMKTCLFLPPERSLRNLMRHGSPDEELAHNIRQSLQTKWAGHPNMNRWRQLDSLAMVQIGG